MNFALTTRWYAGRHSDGEAMLNEILELGFTHVELGYDTRLELIPGIQTMVEQKAVRVRELADAHGLEYAPPEEALGL